MRRGAKPAKAKGESKRPVPRKSGKGEGSRVGDLEKRLAEALKDKAEALEQQTATADILRVISRSPSDIQPVFDAIVQNAVKLCEGLFGTVLRLDGDRLHLAAHHNLSSAGLQAYREHYPVVVNLRETVASGAILDRRVVQVIDSNDPAVPPRSVAMARATGFRGVVVVPMLRDGEPIGVINVARQERGPFTERQVALLQTFADQAVIAIENVRLFNELQSSNRELRTALDQQTATAEILRVISGSPTAVEPVFQAIVQSGLRLLGGYSSILLLVRDDQFHLAAFTSTGPQGDESVARLFPVSVEAEPLLQRTVRERCPVVIEDIETEPGFTDKMRQMIRMRGWRSSVQIPMVRDTNVVGLIAITRREPGRFAADEITLLETFAAQAVIAIENVRLFKELGTRNAALTEALEQQTATSEILRVISQSPTDVGPVFDAILASSTRLCEADYGILFLAEADGFRAVAFRNVQAEFAAVLAAFRQFGAKTGLGRLARDKRPVHIPDVLDDDAYREGEPTRLATINIGGVRTWLGVPLLNADVLIGAIVIYRKEQRAFTNAQIAMLQTFADQAVIAIENVRLFTELEARNRDLTEALEQQTATSEILSVISRSPTDVQPVFDTIARSAVRLCEGARTLVCTFDGELIHLAAYHNATPEALESARAELFPLRPRHELPFARAILNRAVVHVRDVDREPGPTPEFLRQARVRSALCVPLLRDGHAIGVIAVSRSEPRPFSDTQIALLQTFADQAVIAIENVRLFKELEARNRDLTEALEQQTATGEILRVISSSPTDVQPVFDTIVESAGRLCNGTHGNVYTFDGELLHHAAEYNSTPESAEFTKAKFPRRPGRDLGVGRAILERDVVHVPDVEQDPEFSQTLARARGFRSCVVVPLLREGSPIGAIAVTRHEPGPFSRVQIELLRTFADQAVIAIENVRLFTELQEKNRALTTAHAHTTEALEQQTATSEILRVIAGSPTDLQPVLDALVESASRLCQAADTFILLVEGDQLRVAALHGSVEESARLSNVIHRGWVAGRAVVDARTVHVEDLANAEAEFPLGAQIAVRLGHRTALAMPLFRKGAPIGTLFLRRREVRPFSANEIVLLQTFADQAVIAIENVRLFRELEARNREIEDKSHQLEVASQHKSEFLANMSHELRTPLNAVIGFSEVLTERMFGELNAKQDEYVRDIYASGTHLLSLINDILDLSKIEAGRMELELADFHLPQAIENALVLVRERALRRDITLEQSIDSRLGEIQGDERKVKQVLLNLLSNAIKFTPEGGRVEVRAAVVDNTVELSVIDTGVGIAPEDQEAIFEEFRQVGTAEKRAEGTGLGLALARKFIELHGGRIWVESQVGAGSTFTFTLPVRRGD
jgi:two-component system NtrC family sensor kinase